MALRHFGGSLYFSAQTDCRQAVVEDEYQREHHGVEELELYSLPVGKGEEIQQQAVDQRSDDDRRGILHPSDL